jgi:two-component system, NarL family, response regulator LiaR
VNTKILLVDDHEVVRKGIRAMLEDRWEICGEAANGQEAVAKAIELKPDLILMDVLMPVMNGVDATRQIRKSGLSTKILLLTEHNSGEAAVLAAEAGADASITKTCGVDELQKTIVFTLDEKG